MKVFSGTITLKTQGFHDSVDITPQVTGRLNESGIVSGLLTVINPGSTGAITTIEYEPGALEDLRRALERIAPVEMPYAHNERWHDGNGFSHVRAALMKPSLSIPVVDGRLCLGTWQQLVFLDFDNRSRNRTLVVQIIGDESP
jgi:secondary thiamine-phosphate synthase enzyme